MTNTELIRELRALTQAGMKDCKEALEESSWDLQKAVDIVKVKGLAIADGRTGRVATDGLVGILQVTQPTPTNMMVEINCQTDFVANGKDFKSFVDTTLDALNQSDLHQVPFDVSSVETARTELVSSTKENVVVRRWWIEEGLGTNVLVFPYLHSNGKIGSLVTLAAPSYEASKSEEFCTLGFDLAMQVVAMNPLAVSSDRLSTEELDRQKAIFLTQLQEEKKPEKMWDKIMEGKLNKWYKEVCLLEQESIVVSKTTVKQVLKDVGVKLGGEIQIVNFVRCQVGEGLQKKQENFVEEVAKMM